MSYFPIDNFFNFGGKMKNEERLNVMLSEIELTEDVEALNADNSNNEDADCTSKLCEPKT